MASFVSRTNPRTNFGVNVINRGPSQLTFDTAPRLGLAQRLLFRMKATGNLQEGILPFGGITSHIVSEVVLGLLRHAGNASNQPIEFQQNFRARHTSGSLPSYHDGAHPPATVIPDGAAVRPVSDLSMLSACDPSCQQRALSYPANESLTSPANPPSIVTTQPRATAPMSLSPLPNVLHQLPLQEIRARSY
ncbi:hypothetical protein DL93DRAFT_2098556 [Clavulina sp. PMI_390]|nr:hypothetical protein DL93DRAFT_2098556 [Clavulina sp. PMI_390]